MVVVGMVAAEFGPAGYRDKKGSRFLGWFVGVEQREVAVFLVLKSFSSIQCDQLFIECPTGKFVAKFRWPHCPISCR